MGRSRSVSNVSGADDSKDGSGLRTKRRKVAGSGEAWGDVQVDDGKIVLYHCNYCQRDISSLIRIKCGKCTDFDLCVECFSVGVEITPHKSDHPYRVMDNLSFPLFDPDWNADEEVLLLEGVEKYGFGNWPEVAEHVGSKTREQCYEHYMTAYLKSTVAPLPDMSLIAGKTRADLTSTMPSFKSDRVSGVASRRQEPTYQSTSLNDSNPDHPTSVGTPDLADQFSSDVGKKAAVVAPQAVVESEPSTAVKAPAAVASKMVENNKNEPSAADPFVSQRSVGKLVPRNPVLSDLASMEQTGYIAKRDEFDPEYDNDAEILLADMEFKKSDRPVDRAIKIRMLHIYRERLAERQRRKEFIKQRSLLSLKKLRENDKLRHHNELYDRCYVFSRFHSDEKQEELVAAISTASQLEASILELQEFRAAGCHTMAEGLEYQKEVEKREAEIEALRAAVELAQSQLNKTSVPTPRPGEDIAASSSEPASDSKPQVIVKLEPVAETEGKVEGSNKEEGDDTQVKEGNAREGGERRAEEDRGVMDVEEMEGSELLSLSEKAFCSKNWLEPLNFLKVKEVLMARDIMVGFVRREHALAHFALTHQETGAIYDFLVSKKYIRGPPLVRRSSHDNHHADGGGGSSQPGANGLNGSSL